MPNSGIQATFSTSWKSAVALSNCTQIISDRAKVMSDVHNAMFRALRATTSASPRVARMNRAPTSGRKVTSESKGQLLVMGQAIRENTYQVTSTTTPISMANA